MRELFTKLSSKLLVIILAAVAAVLGLTYEIAFANATNYTYSIGIIVCTVILLGLMIVSMIRNDKVAMLGCFTFLAGFLAIYQTTKGIEFLDYAIQEFKMAEQFKDYTSLAITDLITFISVISLVISAFAFLIAKYLLKTKKEVLVDISIYGFILSALFAFIALLIGLFGGRYEGEYNWFYAFYDLFMVVLPLVFLFGGAYTSKAQN